MLFFVFIDTLRWCSRGVVFKWEASDSAYFGRNITCLEKVEDGKAKIAIKKIMNYTLSKSGSVDSLFRV